MASLIERLPQETLLNIGRLFDTYYLELCLNPTRRGCYEVETPEWEGLRSFTRTSTTTQGPGNAAYDAAVRECRGISINLFRPTTACLAPGATLGGLPHRISSRFVRRINAFRVTVPLLFTNKKKDSTALITCTMDFELQPTQGWVLFSSEHDFILPPKDHEETALDLQYQEIFTKMRATLLEELNHRPLSNSRLWDLLAELKRIVKVYQSTCNDGNKCWIMAWGWAPAVAHYESLL